MKVRIKALEQGWLDSFNGRYQTDFKDGELVDDDDPAYVNSFGEFSIGYAVNEFNHCVANGEAIELLEEKHG